MAQYCCQRCHFGGMPPPIHGKMCSHASRPNEFTDVQQGNLSGKNISLVSSFRIHEAEIFSSVDEARHRAQKHCYQIVVTVEVVADDGEVIVFVADNGEATDIADVVANDDCALKIVDIIAVDGFFLLNISATFWDCLVARFKSFLLILYTYDAHTTTLIVTKK